MVPHSQSDFGAFLCWKCQRAVPQKLPERLKCAQCGALQDLPGHIDFFELFALSPALKLESEALRSRFYELSRLTHPDRFTTAPPRETGYALRWSTIINRAYQTLRDPVARAHYLIDRAEMASAPAKIPLDLAEIYFELQDALDEPGGGEKASDFLRDLRERKTEAEQEWDRLAESWSAADSGERLKTLRTHLARRKYLESMISDLENKMKKRE